MLQILPEDAENKTIIPIWGDFLAKDTAVRTNNNGFTLIELMIVVVIIGILAAIAIPNFQQIRERALEASTKRNCHVIQLAAEDYAVGNDGIYSTLAADLTPLLPSAGLMENSFTKVRSEPQFGAIAAIAGEIGIVGVIQGGINVGYTINAIGRHGEILIISSGQ